MDPLLIRNLCGECACGELFFFRASAKSLQELVERATERRLTHGG